MLGTVSFETSDCIKSYDDPCTITVSSAVDVGITALALGKKGGLCCGWACCIRQSTPDKPLEASRLHCTNILSL